MSIYSMPGQRACSDYSLGTAILVCAELEADELRLHLLEMITMEGGMFLCF